MPGLKGFLMVMEQMAARQKAFSGRPSPMLNRASQFRVPVLKAGVNLDAALRGSVSSGGPTAPEFRAARFILSSTI